MLRWPWPDDLNVRTWPVLPEDTHDVQIWTSYVKAFESYRLTDRQTDKLCAVTWQRWRSPIVVYCMLQANLMAIAWTEPELRAIEVYIAGIGILDVFGSCDLDLDPMSFIYEREPYGVEILWDVQIRIYSVKSDKSFKSYCLRDRHIHIGWPKKLAPFLYALTLPNINWFSKLFHYQNQEKICSNTITKQPTAPQVCRYTILWNIKFLKSNNFRTP